MNSVKAVVFATMSYGVLRKGAEMRNATISVFDDGNGVKKRVPVLLCDKVMITIIGGISSVYLWPLYLYRDAKRWELAAKKHLDPTWYDMYETQHIIDYIFS